MHTLSTGDECMIIAQLFSVRAEAAEFGWDQIITMLRDAGFRQVEPYLVADMFNEILPIMARIGVTAPTCHGSLIGDDLPRTLDAAAALDARLVVQPIFRAPRWQSPRQVSSIADDLNRAAEAARPYGMRVAFHNHDDEVRTLHAGRRALVGLMDEVDENVGVQFDPNWAAIGGADPLAVESALGERVFSLHLKDGPGLGANTDQVALGDGTLPWPEILASAPDNTPLVIAPDMFTGDSMDAVIRSYEWLTARFGSSATGLEPDRSDPSWTAPA
jgi:sugar phosphate isomerase/epimerase